MLADAGISLGNQTVLMRGVNDCANVMMKLVHGLVRIRVKPYYYYQCDLAEGTAHFRTSVAKGIEIYESLRGHTTGFAVPTYIIDAIGGGGKTPVIPQYVIRMAHNQVILRNYEGVISKYVEPDDYALRVPLRGLRRRTHERLGVGGLFDIPGPVLEDVWAARMQKVVDRKARWPTSTRSRSASPTDADATTRQGGSGGAPVAVPRRSRDEERTVPRVFVEPIGLTVRSGRAGEPARRARARAGRDPDRLRRARHLRQVPRAAGRPASSRRPPSASSSASPRSCAPRAGAWPARRTPARRA